MSTRLFVKGIIGLLLIGLVGISACGKRELPTESRLSMKEAGVPTTIEELGLPEIPDEENGALVYKEISKLEDTIQKLPEWQVFARMFLSGISRACIAEAKLDAHLGAAEIAVANRIYKQKHGKYVDSLEQLSPEILLVLPLDPFTGKDYIYEKKDKGFIVYSVGEDLRDDGELRRKAREKDYDIVWECAS